MQSHGVLSLLQGPTKAAVGAALAGGAATGLALASGNPALCYVERIPYDDVAFQVGLVGLLLLLTYNRCRRRCRRRQQHQALVGCLLPNHLTNFHLPVYCRACTAPRSSVLWPPPSCSGRWGCTHWRA